MSGARQVEVLFEEKAIAERTAELAARNRRGGAEGSARRGDPQGLVHVRGGLAARDVSRRPRAARRVLSSLELSRGHGLLGNGDDPSRHRIFGEGPRRRARSTTFSNRAARSPSPRICWSRAARGACWSARCWKSAASARCRSRPTSSASSAPICSSSVTAWTSPIPTANCRSSGMSSPRPRRSDGGARACVQMRLSILRRARRTGSRRGAGGGAARRTGGAGPRRFRRAARRRASERIRSRRGRTTAVADRILRLGRPGDRAQGQGGDLRRRPLHRASAGAGRHGDVRGAPSSSTSRRARGSRPI